MRNVLLFDPLLPGVFVRPGEGVEVMAGVRTVGGERMVREVVCAIGLVGRGERAACSHGGPGGQGCLCSVCENVRSVAGLRRSGQGGKQRQERKLEAEAPPQPSHCKCCRRTSVATRRSSTKS